MEKEKFSEKVENLDKLPRVVLHFFRHGEQFKDPEKTNQQFELSEEGRKQAMENSESIEGERNIDQSLAYGSRRRRAQQTAGFAMAGGLDDIEGNESVEELKQKLDPEENPDLKFGSKINTDLRLDFNIDENTLFGKEAYKAFEDKTYLKFIVEKSDYKAEEFGDKDNSTYSRQAAGIAEIVEKYVKVSDAWGKLVQSGKYQDPKLERFMGSHAGVTESFLLKVIEKVKGGEERDRLVALMPNGFDYTEGFDLSVVRTEDEPVLHIKYSKINGQEPEKNFYFEEDVPVEVIDQIIQEGEI